MITYRINWMGPLNGRWLEQHGTHWAAGRIDIRDSSKQGYDGWHEYRLAPMHGEDWNLLSNWLLDLETTEIWDYDMLISIFEGEVLNGRKIRWADLAELEAKYSTLPEKNDEN